MAKPTRKPRAHIKGHGENKHPSVGFDVLFNRALKLRDQGRRLASLAIFNRLIESYPTKPAVWGMRGHVLDLLGRTAEALASFREAVWLSPSSDVASRALFHALIKVGRVDDAFLEAARYLNGRESAEYHTLMSELLNRELRKTRIGVKTDVAVAGRLLREEMLAAGRTLFPSTRKTLVQM